MNNHWHGVLTKDKVRMWGADMDPIDKYMEFQGCCD